MIRNAFSLWLLACSALFFGWWPRACVFFAQAAIRRNFCKLRSEGGSECGTCSCECPRDCVMGRP